MYHATRACLSSVNPRRVYCTVPFAAGYWSDSFTEGAGAKKQKQMPLDMKSPTGIQFRKIYSICGKKSLYSSERSTVSAGKKIFVQFRKIYSICGKKIYLQFRKIYLRTVLFLSTFSGYIKISLNLSKPLHTRVQ